MRWEKRHCKKMERKKVEQSGQRGLSGAEGLQAFCFAFIINANLNTSSKAAKVTYTLPKHLRAMKNY